MFEKKAELAAAITDARVQRKPEESQTTWARRWSAVYHRELARMALDPFDLLLVALLFFAGLAMFNTGAGHAPYRPHSHDGGRTWHVHGGGAQ